jgi:protein N-terminal amidase
MDYPLPNELRVLSVQPPIALGQPEVNMAHLRTLLAPHQNQLLDVIILPEMTLTGYVFSESKDLYALTEESGQGVQFQFFSQLAKDFRAYVFAGYPEQADDGQYFNSMYCIDRSGNLLLNYRKYFLYEEDKRHFKAGSSFSVLEIQILAGRTLRVVPAICMDLNYSTEDRFFDFELATFCKEEKADAIIFCANWLKSSEGSRKLLSYWLQRLTPLLQPQPGPKPSLFLCANRIGSENGTIFAGLSCHLRLNPPEILGCLDADQVGVLSSAIKLS